MALVYKRPMAAAGNVVPGRRLSASDPPRFAKGGPSRLLRWRTRQGAYLRRDRLAIKDRSYQIVCEDDAFGRHWFLIATPRSEASRFLCISRLRCSGVIESSWASSICFSEGNGSRVLREGWIVLRSRMK